MPCTPLQARRRCVRLIRRRVVGIATAVFMATTGGILVQLVSGHDPALARSQTTTAAQSATTSGSSVASGSSPSASSPSSSASSSGSASSGAATAVTTSAS